VPERSTGTPGSVPHSIHEPSYTRTLGPRDIRPEHDRPAAHAIDPYAGYQADGQDGQPSTSREDTHLERRGAEHQ